ALADLTRSWDSTPFIDGLDLVPLGALDPDETLALIRQSQAPTPTRVADSVAEAILAATGGHPYVTQWLCARLWGTNGLRAPTAEDLFPDSLLNRLFQNNYDSLAPAERSILQALATADTLDERTLLRQVGGSIPETQLRYLVQSLIGLGYIRRVGESYA